MVLHNCVRSEKYEFSFKTNPYKKAKYTHASIVGMAYIPLLVNMTPFLFGSSTSTMKLRGIPVLFFIR